MPIIGWKCIHCNREVPLDHFQTSDCGLKLHPDYANAVLHSNDDYYGRNTLTVTDGLSCPRSRALEYDTDVVVNPLDYNPLLTGSAWDTMMEKYAAQDSAKIHLKGEIAGLVVEGEVDRIRRVSKRLIIEDHKHANQYQLRWLKKDIEEGKPVKQEYRIQIRLYAELYRQQFGETPTEGILWTHFSGPHSSYSPVLFPIAFQFADLTLEQCLEHRPYGGGLTVLEILQMADAYHQGKLKPAELPLTGQLMNFGTKSMCDYCQVRDACLTLHQGAAF